MLEHRLGEDKEHCVCGQEFPCPPWLERTRAEVEPLARPQTVEVYREHASPAAVERLEAKLIGEMS